MGELEAFEEVVERAPAKFWQISPSLERARAARPPKPKPEAAPAPLPRVRVQKPVRCPLGEIRCYGDLLIVLRARADELQISRELISELGGLPDRYASKLLSLSGSKRIGMQSLGPLLGALGLKLVAVEDPAAIKRNRHRFVARDKAHVTSAKKFHARPEMQAAADARMAHRNAIQAIRDAEAAAVRAARLKAAKVRWARQRALAKSDARAARKAEARK